MQEEMQEFNAAILTLNKVFYPIYFNFLTQSSSLLLQTVLQQTKFGGGKDMCIFFIIFTQNLNSKILEQI